MSAQPLPFAEVASQPTAKRGTLIYMPMEHEPVLATELVDLVAPQPGEIAIDCTFGGGGHARLIGEKLGRDGELICIDRDPEAEKRFAKVAAQVPCRTRFIRAEYSEALANLLGEGVQADIVYMDLGMSSMQLDAWERGFSYAYDAPLDMRMDPGQETSAREILNDWPQTRLAKAIKELGEERRAGSIAREIVKRRPLATTSDLVEAVKAGVPPADRFGRGNPAKRTFQAIRIAVNGELDNLSRSLPLAWELLGDGGRLATIAFHSLEDRRAKRFMAERAKGCICPPELPVCVCGQEPEAELVTKRAVSPRDEERERNPRSTSAHLRVAQKIAGATG
ncbi:MAG: rRNA (cytosine1402-N4)-methyltransferase [Solirubrobacterales bacterium]|nr:rRNA (cytosine1402-N4)-methyltransferase [Solirubrobacterales bacterium]